MQTPTFSIDDSPGFLVNQLARQLSLMLQAAFRQAGYDVTAPQWVVLNRLWEEEGLHQSELAARSVRDRHTLSRVLTNMESKELVRRKPDPKDKRLARIHLTDKGRELREILPPLAKEAMDKVLSGLTRGDVNHLKRICRHIGANIEHDLSDQGTSRSS